MTRRDIEQGVYRRLNKDTVNVNPLTQSRVRGFVQTRHQRLLARAGVDLLRHGEIAFTSAAGQSRVALPNVARLDRVWDIANDRKLWPLSLDEYRLVNPDPASAASEPTHYVVVGLEAVAQQPTTGAAIVAQSTSTSDVTTLYVEGDSDGYAFVASVALTGTSPVTVAPVVTPPRRLTKYYLAAPAVGTVTLREGIAGPELARIGPLQTAQRYLVIYLHPQPTGALAYGADVQQVVSSLAQDTDEPRLPDEFHVLLELGATLDELGKVRDDFYVATKAEYDELLVDFDFWVATQRATRSMSHGGSRLGPQFPAGT